MLFSALIGLLSHSPLHISILNFIVSQKKIFLISQIFRGRKILKLRPNESRFKSACHSRMNWIISNIEIYLRQFVVFFYRKSQNNSIDFKYPLIKRVNTPLTSTSRIISCTSSSEGLRPNDRTACPTLSFAILPSFFRSNSVKASRTSEKKGYCIFEKVNRLCHCGSNLHFLNIIK